MQEDVRKMLSRLEDLKFDFKQHQEGYSSFHRETQTHHAEMQSSADELRTRFEAIEVLVSNLRKNFAEFQKRSGGVVTSNSQSSNMEVSGFQDLEEAFAKLKGAFETHKLSTEKAIRNIEGSLEEKASKMDLQLLEQRLMDKLQELLNNLNDSFAEKEPVKKKFVSIEKNVSFSPIRRFNFYLAA
jgi:hypothetical protein